MPDSIIVALERIEAKLAELEIKIDAKKSVQCLCHHCGGDGTKGNPDGGVGNCPDCGGDGYTPFGRITLTTEE